MRTQAINRTVEEQKTLIKNTYKTRVMPEVKSLLIFTTLSLNAPDRYPQAGLFPRLSEERNFKGVVIENLSAETFGEPISLGDLYDPHRTQTEHNRAN
jgi:hypothetical protein